MNVNPKLATEKTPEELRALREEIKRVLGYKFKYDSADFELGEEIQVHQVRGSLAGHGSSAFHSYMKQSSREDERQRLMKEEWDDAVYRLEQHKIKMKVDAELAAENAKAKEVRDKRKDKKQNRKKQKNNNKNNDGSDSDDGDLGGDLLVSLFGREVLEEAGIAVEVAPPAPQKPTQPPQPSSLSLSSSLLPPLLPTNQTRSEELSGPQKRKAIEQLECVDDNEPPQATEESAPTTSTPVLNNESDAVK